MLIVYGQEKISGEDSYTQFKEQIINAKDLAKEFVAFSNSMGGIIIFGVSDKEEIEALDKAEVEQIGQLVGNVGQENVKPPIHPLIQNLTICHNRIVVVSVGRKTREVGLNKIKTIEKANKTNKRVSLFGIPNSETLD